MAEKTEEPGMGMKLCVYGISKKFPSIKNLTTNVLVSKMNPATVAQAEKEKDVERKVLLLVCETGVVESQNLPILK